MSQVSSKLRRLVNGYAHWCPGCEEDHPLPDGWDFNGNLESPTFTPSFKHSGYNRRHQNFVCHYVLTDGILNFCADCTHALKSTSVPLPDLPSHF